MSATATHDTKRGEDVRARLNVLTEMPDEWGRRLDLWMGWNAAKKSSVNGANSPYCRRRNPGSIKRFLACGPRNKEEEPCVGPRVKEFLVKALREAKQHSSWIAHDEAYESEVQGFVDRILAEDSPFRADFLELQGVLARHGANNALSQLVVKIASPGVP